MGKFSWYSSHESEGALDGGSDLVCPVLPHNLEGHFHFLPMMGPRAETTSVVITRAICWPQTPSSS